MLKAQREGSESASNELTDEMTVLGPFSWWSVISAKRKSARSPRSSTAFSTRTHKTFLLFPAESGRKQCPPG